MYSEYYEVKTNRSKTWFVVGYFRSEDNLVFERTLDKKNSVLEFFVPKGYEEKFLRIIETLKKQGYVLDSQKKENRLIHEEVVD